MFGSLRSVLAAVDRRGLSHCSTESFLRPFLLQAQQCRSASILASLSDNAGAYNKRIRRGRGPSAGKGKTAGRGHKGQKQHGKVPYQFNGGQTSDYIVHGRRGFKNKYALRRLDSRRVCTDQISFSIDMSPVNLDRIQQWVDAGRLDIKHPITIKELCNTRCLHGAKEGVKLLARGAVALTSPIHIIVSRASDAAIEAVEKAGGSVTTRYYTKSAIKRVRADETHPYHSIRSKPLPFETAETPTITIPKHLTKPFKYRLPDPISRKDLEYYRDANHRGYLSHTVGQGQSPSLFFKSPTEIVARKAASAGTTKKKAIASKDNLLW